MRQLLVMLSIWSITSEKPFKTNLRITMEEGWNQVDGNWVYIKNGVRLTGWQELKWSG